MNTKEKFEDYFDTVLEQELDLDYHLSAEYDGELEEAYVSVITDRGVIPGLGTAMDRAERHLGQEKVSVKADYRFGEGEYDITVSMNSAV